MYDTCAYLLHHSLATIHSTSVLSFFTTAKDAQLLKLWNSVACDWKSIVVHHYLQDLMQDKPAI